MNDAVLVGLLAFAGTVLTSYGGFRLVAYRVEQLEKKVEKHNCVMERTSILEQQIKVANHRLGDLEKREAERCKIV